LKPRAGAIGLHPRCSSDDQVTGQYLAGAYIGQFEQAHKYCRENPYGVVANRLRVTDGRDGLSGNRCCAAPASVTAREHHRGTRRHVPAQRGDVLAGLLRRALGADELAAGAVLGLALPQRARLRRLLGRGLDESIALAVDRAETEALTSRGADEFTAARVARISRAIVECRPGCLGFGEAIETRR